jgi:hypothetical protein
MLLLKISVPAICMAGLLGAATSAAVQESGTQPKAGVPIEKPKIDPPQDITATGCLAREADRFLLKNVAVEIKPWLASTVPNPGPGASRPSPSQTVFVLKNPQGLEKHVGHRIQVSGVVGPATANLPPSPDTIAARGFTGVPQPTSPGPAAVPRLAPPSLDNKGLRMIAASCSQSATSTKQAAKPGSR